MPAPNLTRDETIARILEEMRASRTAQGSLDANEWRSRYPGFADEALQLFDTDRVLVTAASHWKAAGIQETLGSATDGTITHNPSAPDETSPERIGRYRILRPLGEGGMGTVYEAEDPDLRRHVAVKVPHFSGSAAQQTEARQRFLRESRAAAAIQHENVCPIYDVGEDEGRPYVVMAYVEGESLADRLDRGRYDDCGTAVAIIASVASALTAIHEKGIVHRDLKPGNILVRAKDGQPVLTDFGLARVDHDREHATVDGTILGTAAYMAPEQAGFDLGPITPQSDVYSLGVVLFEMLTGRQTFEGNMLQLIHKVATQTAPRSSQFRADLDPALDDITATALARQPRDRYADARAFQNALEGWLATVSTSIPSREKVPPVQPKKPARKPAPTRDGGRRWPRWAVAAAALVAAVVVGGVIVSLRHVDDKQYAEDDDIISFVVPDANATVYIDDERQPALVNEPVVRVKLAAGKHRFSVRQGDREVMGKDFDVKAGQTIEWRAEREPSAGPPSPMDALDPAKIPASERFPWQPHELVAVYGSHAWQGLGDPFWRQTENGAQLLTVAHIGDTLRVTDPATGKAVAQFECKGATASYVSPDGKTVGLFATTPGRGWSWFLWDLGSKKRYPILAGMYDGVVGYSCEVAISPNRKLAATVQPSTTIVWDMVTGKSLDAITTKLENWGVDKQGIVFLPDSTGVVWLHTSLNRAVGASAELVCYDVVKRKERSRFMFQKGTGHFLSDLAVSPDGATVAVPAIKVSRNANNAEQIDYFIDMWDWSGEKFREIRVSPFAGEDVLDVSPDWKKFIVNNTVYDLATGVKSQQQITVPGARYYAFSPDGKKLAMNYGGSARRRPQGRIAVHDATSGAVIQPFPDAIDFLALAPDNKTLALRNSTEPHILRLHDTTTGEESLRQSTPPVDLAYAAFSHSGKYIATTYYMGAHVQVWNAAGSERVAILPYKYAQLQVEFSPDDRLLAVSGSVKLWDVKTWTEHRFMQSQDPLGTGDAMFSPDGKILAVSQSGDTNLFDTTSGAKIGKLSLDWGRPAFIAKGEQMTGGGRVVDIATKKERYQVQASNYCRALTHPDGRSFFTYYVHPDSLEWRGIRQWSVQDGKKLKEWALPFNVNLAAITADGRYLVSSNANGTVYVLRLSPAQP